MPKIVAIEGVRRGIVYNRLDVSNYMFNQREYRLKRQSLAPKIKCECGCGEVIPSISYDNKPMKFKHGHGSTGEKCNLWKGGISKTWSGYTLILVRKHPFKSKANYVRLHRLIYEEYLTKLNGIPTYIHPSLDIHHIDGNINNNEISNLQIISHREHTVLTHTVDKTNRLCLICNGKTFVKRNGHEDWYKYKDGFICNKCKMKEYHLRYNR